MSGELGPFASVGLELPVDAPETSVGLAGGVVPVSVGVPVDAPASGEAAEGDSKPDVSVGVPVVAGIALGSAVGDPVPEPGVEGSEGGTMTPILGCFIDGLLSIELPVIFSQAGNINHG